MKKLLIVIPCLNEAEHIEQVIQNIPTKIPNIQQIDILVVDDGSSDETTSKATAAGAFVIRHPINYGLGRALQTAIQYAIEHTYDLMVNLDGDGQFDPNDIPKLIQPIVEQKYDMATASRFIDASLTPNMPTLKRIGNHMMSWLVSIIVQKKFYDVSCGFRCYSRESLLNLNLSGGFTYTQEMFLNLIAKKLSVIEVPISVRYFEQRTSRIASNLINYGFHTAMILFRGFRDYFPLRFFWSIALVFFIPAFIFSILFWGHYIITNTFTGYLFAGFLSGFFIFIALTFFVLGVVADMLDRIRANQEHILYMLKKTNKNLK